MLLVGTTFILRIYAHGQNGIKHLGTEQTRESHILIILTCNLITVNHFHNIKWLIDLKFDCKSRTIFQRECFKFVVHVLPVSFYDSNL